MVKEIISSRNEDYSFFIQCSCGSEVIQLYYYKETSISEEIIGLKYYGCVKDIRLSNFTFTRESFNLFVDMIAQALNPNESNKYIKDGNDHLAITKDKYGFYILSKSKEKTSWFNKEKCVWDINIREPEMKVLKEKLLDMKSIILGENKGGPYNSDYLKLFGV